MEEKVVVFSEENEEAVEIEEAHADFQEELPPSNHIYDKLNIPIKVLDGVIIGGIVVIVVSIFIGVFLY